MATVQELAARVTVQGVAQYMGHLSQMERGWQKFTNTVRATTTGAQASFGGFGGALGGLGGMLAGGALIGGVVGLGTAAVKAAADWEVLEQSLIAVTGSAAEAQKKLEFARKLSIPALATSQELAAAAVQLENFGVKAEAVLPAAAKLQAAFRFRPEALQDAVRMFGMMASGRMPEVEMLAGFGMNKAMFARAGIKFDTQGQLLSSARDTFAALLRIVEGKYGNILDLMANTTSSKLSTVQDRWEEMLRRVGKGLKELLLPVLENLIKILDDLGNSDAMQRWAVNSLEMLGKMMKTLAVCAALWVTIAGVMAILTKNAPLAMISAVKVIALLAAASGMEAYAKKMAEEARIAAPWQPPKKPGATQGEGPMFNDKFTEAQSATAMNTARAARAAESIDRKIDYRRGLLGGGELARMGVTPVELAGFRHGRSEIIVNVRNAKSIEQLIGEIAAQTYNQLQRQRARA